MLSANRSLNFLLNLAIFTLFISPINNQESQVTKNPMEQVKLEFQILRAKNNLCARSKIEQTTITERNCSTLFYAIADIFNPTCGRKLPYCRRKLIMPAIYVTNYLKSAANQRAFLKYDIHNRVLTIDQTLLETLTLSEFKLLLEHELNFAEIDAEYYLDNHRSGWKSCLKGFALGLAAPFLAIFILPAILALKLSTKQTIQWTPLGTAVLFASILTPLWITTALTCHADMLFFLAFMTEFAALFVVIEIIVCIIACYFFHAKTTAKFSEIKRIPYCPNPELVAPILNNLTQNCAEHKTAKFDNWLNKRKEHLEFVSYGYHKQQEQIALSQAIEAQFHVDINQVDLDIPVAAVAI